jgi:TPR repeat protein
MAGQTTGYGTGEKGAALLIKNTCAFDILITSVLVMTKEEKKSPVPRIWTYIDSADDSEETFGRGVYFTSDGEDCGTAEWIKKQSRNSCKNLPVPVGGSLRLPMPWGNAYFIDGINASNSERIFLSGVMINPDRPATTYPISFPETTDPDVLFQKQLDNKLAVRYLISAEKGNPDAQYWVAEYYRDGRGLPQSYTDSAKWYEKAALQNDMYAQDALSRYYAAGQGVEKDYQQAYYWATLRELCRKPGDGDAFAPDKILSLDDLKKKLQDKDEGGYRRLIIPKLEQSQFDAANTKIISWWELEKQKKPDLVGLTARAERGDANAQNELGVNYFYGRGVSADKSKAFVWFMKAAQQNDARGQRNVAIHYRNGYGVEKNLPEAHKWYHLAAKQGEMESQRAVGYDYEKGIVMPQNYGEAYFWYSLGGADDLEEVSRHLTAQQKKIIQQRVLEWKPE